jgi:hypothetical protein
MLVIMASLVGCKEIMSFGVADKKSSTSCIEIIRRKIHRLAEFSVPLPSTNFKRCKNG